MGVSRFIPIDPREHILKHYEVQAIRDTTQPRVLIPMHYRHPDLDSSEDGPQALGPIDPWLAARRGVTQLTGRWRSLMLLPDCPCCLPHLVGASYTKVWPPGPSRVGEREAQRSKTNMLSISATAEWRTAHPGATIGLLELSEIDNTR